MHSIRLAMQAMATRFELLLVGEDPVHARAAGEEAMREIRRIEGMCNFYDPSSELSRINLEASQGPFRVSGMMQRLLVGCARWAAETRGRFDPTVAPALDLWGLRHRGEPGRIPTESERLELQQHLGLDRVEFDRATGTVRLPSASMKLDFGGVAKGWALDEARLILEEAGVEHALLHGGTSTAIGIGQDESGNPWRVAFEDPYLNEQPTTEWFADLTLVNAAFSVSGVHGKSFPDPDDPGSPIGHVINPLTGLAVSGRRVTLVRDACAARADAWSTALLADPSIPLPDDLRGTTFLKTDSGWTIESGEPVALNSHS